MLNPPVSAYVLAWLPVAGRALKSWWGSRKIFNNPQNYEILTSSGAVFLLTAIHLETHSRHNVQAAYRIFTMDYFVATLAVTWAISRSDWSSDFDGRRQILNYAHRRFNNSYRSADHRK